MTLEYNSPQPPHRGRNINNSWGVAALIMGILACLAAFVPCIGTIPAIILATLGLVVGLIGLILAVSNKQSSIVFPVAGMSACVLAFVILLIWALVISESAAKQQQQFQRMQSTGGR